jgi:hypothetical protein
MRKAGPKVNAKKRGKVFYVELTFPFGIKGQSERGKYGVVKLQREERLGYEKAISSLRLKTLYVETTNKFSTRRKSQEWKLSHITLDGPAQMQIFATV